jgi:hypothetical protein
MLARIGLTEAVRPNDGLIVDQGQRQRRDFLELDLLGDPAFQDLDRIAVFFWGLGAARRRQEPGQKKDEK